MASKARFFPYAGLGAAALIVVAYHWFGYYGHYGYDDMEYARIAAETAWGAMPWDNNHYNFRWTVTLPTALFYALFGVNDSSSAIFPMAMLLVLCGLLWATLRRYWGGAAVLLGLAFLLGNQWLLFYSDKLMPDLYVVVGGVAAALVYYRQRTRTTAGGERWAALWFSLSLFFGFLAKLSLVFFVPAFLLVLGGDLLQRRLLRFWGWVLGFTVLLGASYGLLFWVQTGDPIFRYHAIVANGYFLPDCSYDQLPLAMTLRRISYQLPELFLRHYFLTTLLAVPIAVGQLWGSGRAKVHPSSPFFARFFLVLLLAANFLSVSPRAYAPLCLDPRHYLFLVPFAALVAAPTWYDLLRSGKGAGWLAVWTTLLAVVAYGLGIACWPYALLAMVATGRAVLPRRELPRWATLSLAAVTVVALAWAPWRAAAYARTVPYPAQRALYYDFLAQQAPGTLVLTDHVQANYGEYYGGFKAENGPIFLRFGQEKETPETGGQTFLLLNWHTQMQSSLRWDDLPAYAREAENRYGPPIHTATGLQLFALPKAAADSLLRGD
ncbi:glycosyltransferase family 39 protein [Neolewinella lacunae]|uniref:Glycosyltransferase RgtA/B/C/D-like domain-containing protein n=1 Tax=Neolewinella lacunae TaxID=1517758 RepID=A0A923PEX2_9BACT|nr:glycosyltransferase family 39 protein [Neolewinella lacunae]MBC6992820.1 hypothetical protein [Neolewinella lacunae]MDN3636091.1 glycosyltransferase family 39 protein [Neolewinella lacunae]